MGRARSHWVRLRGEGAVGLGLEHGRDVTCGVGRARALCRASHAVVTGDGRALSWGVY